MEKGQQTYDIVDLHEVKITYVSAMFPPPESVCLRYISVVCYHIVIHYHIILY